jgi:hypothetical protein
MPWVLLGAIFDRLNLRLRSPPTSIPSCKGTYSFNGKQGNPKSFFVEKEKKFSTAILTDRQRGVSSLSETFLRQPAAILTNL